MSEMKELVAEVLPKNSELDLPSKEEFSLEMFRDYIATVTDPKWVNERMQTLRHDYAVADLLEKYDPELARLMRRNVNNCRSFYEYVLRKKEIEMP